MPIITPWDPGGVTGTDAGGVFSSGNNGSTPTGTPATGVTTDPANREFGTMLQAISEGPIVGLVDGLKSVYLDGTAVLSATGSKNFTGIALALTAGTNTQAMIPGFVDTESETSVNVQIKYSTGPATRTISTSGISAVRVRLSVPSLKKIDPSSGAESGWDVRIKIERQSASYTPPGGVAGDWEAVTLEGGGWIYGKFGAKYTKSFRIETPVAGPWSIKVTRLDPDHTSGAPDYIQDETWWDAYTEVTDVKLRHPFTALAALRVDAKQFQTIPRLTMDIKGRIIKIPSNYNPTTRAYTGIWDGTFTDGWTDNPAWIWYDMATHTRYGAGSFLDASKVDKWSLYTIAQACDVLVSDGNGGTEPRFRCSLYIQNQVDAIKLLQEMASIFRGMIYWAGGVVSAVQDADASPVAIFTNSNVKDGRFTYQGSARKSRHTAALVSWQDPNNGYETSIEYVEDHAAIARYGFNSTSIAALGATSQAQARRLGLWTLLTETMDTEVVMFSGGLEGSTLRPGNIIGTQDQFRAAQGRLGGRVMAGASTTVIPLDGETVLPAGTNTLSVRLPSGLVETQTVTTPAGTTSVITVGTPFSAAPALMAQWALNVNLYRVLGIKKGDGLYYDITALQHTPSKYALIDTVTVTPGSPVTPPGFPVPTSIVVSDTVRIERDKVVQTLTAYWTGSAGASYVAEASQDSGPWKPMEVNATSANLDGITSGSWRVRVQSVFTGGSSSWAVATHTVAPPTVTGGDVNAINSVDYLSNADKINLIADWTNEQQTQTQLDAQASALGLSSTAYDNAVSALSTNLIAAGAPSNWATTWPDGTAWAHTGIMTSLKTWWASVATQRATIQKTVSDTIKNNAAYADAMARSSYNLIKNGNSEDPNATGPEALGVTVGNAYAGNNCRSLAGTGQYDITSFVQCDPGQQIYLEAYGKRVGTAGGNARVYIAFFAADKTTILDYVSIEALTGSYAFYSASRTAPANTSYVLIRVENDTVPGGCTAYWDAFYACRKISAGMLEADLGIFGVIRSGGDSSGTGLYVPGSTGNAPVGFKISAFPFTCTYIDGTTDATCQMELGGSANFGGFKVAAVNTRVMTAFNRIVNGSFYADLTGWNAAAGTVPVVYNASTSDTGSGSASVTAPNATAVAGRISQAFAIPPSNTTINLTLKTACTMGGSASSAGGVVTITLTNMETGVTTTVGSWTYTYGTQPTSPSWTARSVDVTSILSGGGSFLLTVGCNTVKGDAAGTGTVYIDNVKIIL